MTPLCTPDCTPRRTPESGHANSTHSQHLCHSGNTATPLHSRNSSGKISSRNRSNRNSLGMRGTMVLGRGHRHSHSHLQTAAHRGLTFIELLVAVALSALIIVTAAFFTTTLTQTWTNLQTRPQFEQHVQGVTSLLETLFERTDKLSNSDAYPFGWSVPPGGNSNTKVFAFRISDPLPVFVLPYGPDGQIDAWLDFDQDKKRLWLVWYTENRLTDNRRQINYTLVSESVEDIELGYHDSGTNLWEFESMGKSGRTHADRAPSRIRLTFAPGGDSSAPMYRVINPERALRNTLRF